METDNRANLEIMIAAIDDVLGIYNTLKSNLIEIEDVNEITSEDRKNYEDKGFLRKEVNQKYFKELIKNPNILIYIAKMEGKIIGFASIYKNMYDINEFRTTLRNLNANDGEIRSLLTDKNSEFAYLDQVSIRPEYKRKGIGRRILNEIFKDIDLPIVSFIVMEPLANMASAFWHESMEFVIQATCDGEYKGKSFEWRIYIHNNKKPL